MVSRDFGKPEVRRQRISGLDWAIAGLAMAPAASPTPVAARKLRRFMVAFSCLETCRSSASDRIGPRDESLRIGPTVRSRTGPPARHAGGGLWSSGLVDDVTE